LSFIIEVLRSWMEYYRSFRIKIFLAGCLLSTTLHANHYHEIFAYSRQQIAEILQELKTKRALSSDAQIAFIAKHLEDIPYLYQQAMGEGDWQANSWIYKPGALHFKQNPVYRMDGLNCQTLVQVAMALYESSHAHSLDEFDKNYLRISYGAAGNPDGEIVHFYNRNHFIEADFNPVNHRNGILKDVTRAGILSSYAKNLHAHINRHEWFLRQRYQKFYTQLPLKHFNSEEIDISYLPADVFAAHKIQDAIPTPAIAEVVRDPDKWRYAGMLVKNIIGTELTVSHLGLLYRKTFKHGDVIYHKVACEWYDQKKMCESAAIYCQKKTCKELMFTHASTSQHHVVSIPLFDYLRDNQMEDKSFLGVHVERM